MPKSVGRAVLEAGGADGRRPLVGAPLVQVQVPATDAGEEQAGVEPRRQLVERLRGSQRQRDRSQRASLLAVEANGSAMKSSVSGRNSSGSSFLSPTYSTRTRSER